MEGHTVKRSSDRILTEPVGIQAHQIIVVQTGNTDRRILLQSQETGFTLLPVLSNKHGIGIHILITGQSHPVSHFDTAIRIQVAPLTVAVTSAGPHLTSIANKGTCRTAQSHAGKIRHIPIMGIGSPVGLTVKPRMDRSGCSESPPIVYNIATPDIGHTLSYFVGTGVIIHPIPSRGNHARSGPASVHTLNVKAFPFTGFHADSGSGINDNLIDITVDQGSRIAACTISNHPGIVLKKHQCIGVAPCNIHHITAEVILCAGIRSVSIAHDSAVLNSGSVLTQEGNSCGLAAGRNINNMIPISILPQNIGTLIVTPTLGIIVPIVILVVEIICWRIQALRIDKATFIQCIECIGRSCNSYNCFITQIQLHHRTCGIFILTRPGISYIIIPKMTISMTPSIKVAITTQRKSGTIVADCNVNNIGQIAGPAGSRYVELNRIVYILKRPINIVSVCIVTIAGCHTIGASPGNNLPPARIIPMIVGKPGAPVSTLLTNTQIISQLTPVILAPAPNCTIGFQRQNGIAGGNHLGGSNVGFFLNIIFTRERDDLNVKKALHI